MATTVDGVMLHVANVSKSYGSHEVLREISLDVAEGETIAIVGPNGAGKSTLLKLIAGQLELETGEITIAGAMPGSTEARRAVSFVSDNPVLYDDLSVIEHLEYIARMHDYEDWEPRAEQLIELLGLTARRDDLPARFSRGLRQKTSLAIGLVRPLDLLLVDEPFVGLDASGKKALLELLEATAADGATVVVSTHEHSFVDRSDRCIVLRDGEIAGSGVLSAAEVAELAQ
jgi:ABC-2 type transport system ATP-binding protein